MLQKLFRGLIDKTFQPAGRALGRWGVSPNLVTLAGTVTVAAGCWLVISGYRAGGGWVIGLGGALDVLDGAIAKGAGLKSTAGAFLDSTTDRLADGMALGTLAWVLSDQPLGLALALIALVLGFTVSYIRARAESLGLECNVGLAERAERMVLVAVGLIFDVVLLALWVLVALSVITAVQRFVHVYAQARRATP